MDKNELQLNINLVGLTCRICNFISVSQNGIASHISKKHNIKEYYDTYIKKENEGECKVCKKETRFNGLFSGYSDHCSYKCSANDKLVQDKMKKTMMINHGVDNIFRKNEYIQECMVKKHGVAHPYQLEEFREKGKQTCFENHGVYHQSQSEEVRQKCKNTCKKNHGVENPSQCKEIQDKKIQTNLKHHGVEQSMQSEKVREKSIQTCKRKYGVNNWSSSIEGKLFHRLDTIKRISIQNSNDEPLFPAIGPKERKCLNELQSYSPYQIIRNDPKISKILGRWPDGHIPELNLFIQFDETDHFIDKKTCKIYKGNNDNDCTSELASLGYIIFRISEIDWKNNKQNIIEQFKFLVDEFNHNQNSRNEKSLYFG